MELANEIWFAQNSETIALQHTEINTRFLCIAGGDAVMEVETGAASAAGPTAPSTAVEEDEDCHATYQLIGVLTHKVHV
jgi:hypothetical protein